MKFGGKKRTQRLDERRGRLRTEIRKNKFLLKVFLKEKLRKEKHIWMKRRFLNFLLFKFSAPRRSRKKKDENSGNI